MPHRRAQTVISTLEVFLGAMVQTADLHREREKTAITNADRESAQGSRLWCEGAATAYENAINELREEFGEGGEDEDDISGH